MHSTTKISLTTLATLAIALALLQGTGAVQLTQGDDIGESIVLEPHPGPNGQYAYYDEDDELAIELTASNPDVEGDGPNDDAVTAIPEVFTITNEGDSTARVWIESGHPLATFTARDGSIEGADRAVHLAPNESVAVGLRVVTTDDVLPDVVVDSFEVNAVVADESDAGSGDAGTDDRTDGGTDLDIPDETLTTVASPAPNERRVRIQNPDGPVTVDLDGMHVAGANVTLDRVAFDATVDRTVVFDAVGRPEPFGGLPGIGDGRVLRADGYVQVDDERIPTGVADATVYASVDRDYLDWRGADPDDVTVYRLADGEWTALDTRVVERGERVHYAANASRLSSVVVATRLPAIEVTDARLESPRVAPGEAVTVTAELMNAGLADGERTVPVTVDGEHVGSLTVELRAEESTTVSERVSFDEPGEYELSVDGVDAGTVVVADDSPPVTDEPADPTQQGTPAAADREPDPAQPGTTSPRTDTDTAPPRLVVLMVVTAATLLVVVVLGRRLVAP
ncbi:CARDB domain-containing protein [Haloarchaeobius sp. FL176]|uniref:CARDB domain-containing protein n=1 Tax=Haloarchaeobius sp. FL176 TaxID=2967129 RepID=UPI00214952C1|nr:CARDB domain-containing protein [Haloarchaeobius sp. FL176]